MTRVRTLDDLDVAGKRVLVRVDFNVPMKDGEVTDDTRIRAALPTIEALSKKGAKVILLSHFGRPKGVANPEYTLRPVAAKLAEILGGPVEFASDCVGEAARKVIARMIDGDVARRWRPMPWATCRAVGRSSRRCSRRFASTRPPTACTLSAAW